jgi:hypothetical protein
VHRLEPQLRLDDNEQASASVGAADPGARLISELAGISEVSVQKLRIAMLMVAPASAGLFLTFSVMLLGRRRIV